LAICFVRNQRSGANEMRLLPQGPAQLSAFLVTTLGFVFVNLLVKDDHSGLGRYDGSAFLLIYLVCLVASGLWSWRKTNESEQALRRFVAMHIDALKHRIKKD
jgi:hypothetical protein